jgi:Flp pilus assembly protein TadG
MSAISNTRLPFSRIAARMLRFGRCRKGAAAVEFALVAPTLFIVLMGLFEFGLFAWNRHSLEHATEETARVVMMKTAISDTQVAAEIKARASSIPADEISASVTQETVGTTTFVTMSVAYTYNYFLLGAVIGLEPIVIVSKSRVPLRPGT